MKRFKLICPDCGTKYKVCFENIQVGGYGATVNFRCMWCDTQHMLGGTPEWRELKDEHKIQNW